MAEDKPVLPGPSWEGRVGAYQVLGELGRGAPCPEAEGQEAVRQARSVLDPLLANSRLDDAQRLELAEACPRPTFTGS